LRILITISHPSHANFFKEATRILSKEGHKIFISVLDRGRLVQIVDKEYSEFERFIAGKHKGNRFSIIFNVNILRFLKLLIFSFIYEIDFGLSVGSFTLGAALKLLFKPNIQFDDDPERHINIALEKITCTKLFFPPVIEPGNKITIFNSLKEWAHTSPKYFTPEINILEEFGLRPKEYILIREISTKSLNYMSQDSNIVFNFLDDIPKDYKVVLSLEDKKNFYRYPENWIILNEPVNDFYSLVYYSKLVISTGDSMAREAAMLGVPGIYCGFRKMKANDILIKKGMVFHSKPENVIILVKNILNNKIKIKEQQEIRNELMNEWEDVTELIVNVVRNYKNRN
jgi:uncharacterized protein